MIKTATAFTMACAKRGSGPKATHAMNVTIAIAITAGTNQPAYSIRQPLDWGSRALRLADHLHDLRQHGLAANALGPP